MKTRTMFGLSWATAGPETNTNAARTGNKILIGFMD
jgi:hypothetical protein